MNKKIYTGSKTQNHFTAYLLRFIHGKRHEYLEKKIRMADVEELLEDIEQMEARVVIEELWENQNRELLLLQEAEGKYPEWNRMSDNRLVEALYVLSEEERKLIYQHVFEERSFKEMSSINGITEERCKGIYYYAIRKIRKAMGGDR
jgi:RNA polymerase sigma factor (sigma-70 family)